MFPKDDLDLTWELTMLAVTALGLLVLLLIAIGLVQFVRRTGSAVVKWRCASSHQKLEPTGLAVDNGPRYARILILLPLLAFVGLAVVFGWSLARDQARPQNANAADPLPMRLSESP
jgi:hypothetical protein